MIRALLAALLLLASHSHALTLVPEEEYDSGRVFDTNSPRSQKMQRILCFGRDPNYCASLDAPPRYYGFNFRCDWPPVFPERVTPDDRPDRRGLFLPGKALIVGEASRGQTCLFELQLALPPSFLGTKDQDDLMAWVEWEFEKAPIPGLKGQRDGKKVMLPLFIVSKRDGSHMKSPWDGSRSITYDGITRAKQSQEMSLLPSRVDTPPQKSWITVIINGQVLEKAEVPLTTEPLRWQIYDWRRKNGEVIERRHGG
ncbi:hypothetical protein [Uliginosibacterium aquaticum]|uniref:Uncharacterized protein n=1 Tax=Uliginosibacterium aquaticum TaxID=2731212 RepID=A0ABX2IC14_9RHOO|nr:hypothetical protein [Uliginosibacterium aquaticum]NSL53497.1 hypothetical protein [Uliginosibacterium aquaticum]